MENKEKQIIEELANDIYSLKSCDTSFEENCKLLAYDLFTLGWIKSNEDSVVLPKEEYNKLRLQIQQAHNKGVQAGFDLTKFKENSIEKARKEMAESLLSEFYYITRFYYNDSANIFAWAKDKATKLGVEIKE